MLREDLEAVDAMLVQSMASVRDIERQGVTAEFFQDVIMETFTTLTTDDRVVELKVWEEAGARMCCRMFAGVAGLR